MKAAVFLLSAAALAHEVCLLRALDVANPGHSAPLVVSVALLGFGFAATLLARFPRLRGRGVFPLAAALYAASIPASVLLSRQVDFNLLRVGWERREWLSLLLLQAVHAVPFTLVGLAILGAIARAARSPGATYAANLLGSGAGALAAGSLLHLGPPEAVLRLLALAASVAAALGGRGRGRSWAVLGFLAVLGLGSFRLEMSPFKALRAAPDKTWIGHRQGPRGRVDRVRIPTLHLAPGLSLLSTAPLPPQDGLFVDGQLIAAVDRGPSDYYRETVDALPLVLAEPASTVLLGVGPGLAFADLVVDADGNLLELAGVRGTRAPPRRWLRSGRAGPELLRIDVSHGDPLREDPLLTVEAFEEALACLAPGGQLAVTTGLETPPRPGLRLLRIADAVTPHVIALRSMDRLAVVLRRDAAPADARERLRAFAERYGFDIVRPASWRRSEPFHRTETPLDGASGNLPYDVRPTTDLRPYFHRFFRWSRSGMVLDRRFIPFVEWEFVAHVVVLLQMALLAGLLLVVPVFRFRVARTPALTFLALGFGYMLAEMAWLGFATVKIGSATLAAAAVLGGFLVGSGLGSLVGERWGRPLRRAALAAAVLPVALVWVLPTSALAIGLLASVAAFPLGMPFPAALARVPAAGVPWALAWNGFASVLAAAGAPLLSSSFSLPVTALVAAGLYLVVAARGG